MIDGLDGNAVPGIAIAALALIGVIYQARVGVRPADRAGFQAEFEAAVRVLREDNAELRRQNEELDAKIDMLEAKLDERTFETRALAGYTRELLRDYQARNLPAPAYFPPPNLDKHLR